MTRGKKPVVGVIGRHLNVGDDHIRPVRAGHPDQRARVCRSTDHVESAVLEDVHDPFPDKGLVLSD